MEDLAQILDRGEPVGENSPLTLFINTAIATCWRNEKKLKGLGLNFGECLASIFDLAISGVYASKVGNNGWVFCRNHDGVNRPTLLYPFVNACPRCSVDNNFVFTPSKKPESAVIGKSTSTILATIFQNLVKKNIGSDCSVYTLNGSGVVDAYIRSGHTVCLLEIKAAPLVTFPFSMPSEDLVFADAEGTGLAKDHQQTVVPNLNQSNISIELVNTGKSISLGKREENVNWAFNKLMKYVDDFTLLSEYLVAWKDIYDRYSGKNPKKDGYWLANGCGQPVPRPSGWPARRVGSGFESISDSKSSVGMDRTDDIKKGIYQVLKIGTHYKEYQSQKEYRVVTALASNMHAIRHHDDYLGEMEDIIWSIDADDRPYKIKKTSSGWSIPIEGVHNLYDGLISLTRIYARDEWLKKALAT